MDRTNLVSSLGLALAWLACADGGSGRAGLDGAVDCSSPYVTKLLDYMRDFEISYTAWALWPQNSSGPGGLGACGYPSVMSSSAAGDFRQCLDRAACAGLIKPLPWAGETVFNDIRMGK